MRELALFAGAGGGILAGELLGDTTVCAVERDRAAASVLVRRQNDGHLQPFPIWDDVCTFDGRAWRGVADVVSGGFPCQDISIAGAGDGLDGERSGLWREMARVVREVEPCFVRVENSPMLTARGLGVVLADLAALGFDARWDVLSAADCGAYHQRERIWIVAAHPDRLRELQPQGREQEGRRRAGNGAGQDADAGGSRLPQPWPQPTGEDGQQGRGTPSQRGGWPAEPGLVRMVHGVPHRVDRIKALGNAQVPRVAATAWTVLMTPNV
jgi:DNA (cytosine-5)-methyltransferase 1